MIRRIINNVMHHLGITQSQVDKLKEIINMIEFVQDDGKTFMIVRLGKGVELRIEQEENSGESLDTRLQKVFNELSQK